MYSYNEPMRFHSGRGYPAWCWVNETKRSVALCLSWLKLDRTKMTWKSFFSCRLIALRLVRSRVRCFVVFLLSMSLWPGHAKAMDEWASIKLILHDKYYSPSSGWVSCLGGKKRNRQEETEKRMRERHWAKNTSRRGQDLNVRQH